MLREDRQRVKYWDMAKGFAILLVIVGHAEGVNPYLRGLIFSFHMPFFFVANGYFVKNYDIRSTFKKSVKSLLIPYMIVCIISTLLYVYTNYSESYIENINNLLQKIVAMIWGMSKSSNIFTNIDSVWLVWFVICLFFSRNIYVIILHKIDSYKLTYKVVIITLLSFVGIVIGERIAFLPWSLDVAFVSFPFIMAGDYLSKYKLFEKHYMALMFVSLILWIIPLAMKMHIELAVRSYPMGIVSVIEAIGGSISVIGVFWFLEKRDVVCTPLSWLGRNSMIILAVHCLEMMYFDWNRYVFNYIFVSIKNKWYICAAIKVTFIIFISWLIVVCRDKLKRDLVYV